MNDDEEIRLHRARIALITISSFMVTIPQLLWTVLGYGGTLLILADTALIIIGFATLLIALTNPLPYFVSRALGRFRRFLETNSFTPKTKGMRPYISLVMVLYLLVPYTISTIMGYIRPSFLLLALYVAITVICVAFLIKFHKQRARNQDARPWHYLVVLTALGLLWTFAFWYGSPSFPTDEMALDFYSAHLLINGINPYIPINTANVFTFYSFGTNGLPLDVVTPYSSGGFVTSLSYPALAVFTYLPANLFGFSPTASLIPLYVIPPIFLYWVYKDSKLKSLALVPVFLLLLNPSYLVQVSLGYPDIVWMLFTMLSVFFYRKPVVSGILMGLAVSVKQIPWLVLPFFLIFLYREIGRGASLKWTLSVAGVFLLANSIFIALNPQAFFSAIAAPELQHILGIGFGPSQIAFLDIFPLSRTFFSLMVVALFVSSIIAYYVYYGKLKYAFLAFPIIIFLFNYRLLLSYLMFWPLIALIMPLFIQNGVKAETRQKEPARTGRLKGLGSARRIVVPVILVALIAAPVAYEATVPVHHPQIDIQGLSITGVSNYNVTGIEVMVSLQNTNISYNQLLYRIMPSAPTTNMNGYLWEASNFTQLPNGSELIQIAPMNQNQQLSSSGSYRLIAYYGFSSDAYVFNLSSGKLS